MKTEQITVRPRALFVTRAAALLTACVLWGAGLQAALAGDDPSTEFSKQVTAAIGDWKAQDWRRGVIKLHPSKFTWQSDSFLELIAEEPLAGRTPQQVLEGYFANTQVEDNQVDMRTAKELAPGILARSFRWESGFDDNLGFWGVVTTAANSYVAFSGVCEFAHPEDYVGKVCVEKMLKLLLLVQAGKLKVPEPPAPLNVPGWEGQYLTDGTSVLTQASYNGLRKALVYASAPTTIAPAQLRAAITRFADSTAYDDDGAPAPLQWVGKSEDDPWIKRQFPEAFEGPSIQMAGSVRVPDGRAVLVSVRCPNEGWLKDCAYGVAQTMQALSTGEVEKRRQKVIAATQVAPPVNGLQSAQILGLYTEGRNTMGAGGFMTGYTIEGHLYLRDGTVMRDFDKPPAYIDPAASRKNEPQRWGLWKKTTKAMTITWHDGDTDTIEIDDNDNLMIGAPKGMRLAGSYRHVSGSGTIAFGGGSSFFSESSYTFYPDGTFTSDRSSSFMVGPGGGENATAIGGSQGAEARGRYLADGYTLTLTYPDGRISRLSLAVYAHEIAKQERGLVILNGTVYFRSDEK